MTDIAAILREHNDYYTDYETVGIPIRCQGCDALLGPEKIDHESCMDALAAHQAEKVWEALRAGGWVQGHEETMVIPCISPAGHEWGDLNRCIWCGRGASLVNVRRYVTDWEKA